MSGLSENNLDDSYTHVLTGYVRNDTFLLEVVKTVQKLKEKNPGLLYGKERKKKKKENVLKSLVVVGTYPGERKIYFILICSMRPGLGGQRKSLRASRIDSNLSR